MSGQDIVRDFLGHDAADALESLLIADLRFHAPRCPEPTCAMTDKAKGRVERAALTIGGARAEMELESQPHQFRLGEWRADMGAAERELGEALRDLEELRHANERLRKSSFFWRSACERIVDRLRLLKCGSCGGSGKYLNRSIARGEELVECKSCGGSGLHALARSIIGGK